MLMKRAGVRVVMQSEKMTGKKLPYFVLPTRNSSIRTRSVAYIANGLMDVGITGAADRHVRARQRRGA
jgi:hypothetical protein